ncbi:MAG: right-handed parallel beta-helix repeat-containing protein [Candidatus Acidiferrales bacterium]
MVVQVIRYRAMRITVVALILLGGGVAVARGQASVNESSESSTLYVNSTSGSDANPGTEQAPFKTLTKGVNTALAQSQKGIGTKVTVLPGTYRESIAVSGSSTAPVTVEAATAGTVTVSGADVWTGWTVYSGNSSVYTHAWPYAWGNCAQLAGPTEQIIVRRQEMIFVNGFPLTQVLSLADMMVGTFYVNESARTVYIWPPSGTAISSATVEVSTRSSLFELQGVQNWVLRGMTFQYARGCRNTDTAVFVTQKASDILIDTDNFLWNNSIGLDLGDVTNVTVKSSQANHNGQDGIFAQYLEDGQWTSDEASYNNWRGAQGAYYAWNVAGMKFGEVHDSTIDGFQAYFNESHGLHFDTDIRSITVDSLTSIDNLNGGIQLEADPGPVTLSGAEICGNNRMQGTYSGGVNITDSSYITVTNSTIYNNNSSQFMVWGRTGGIAVTNYQTGATSQVYNQNFTFDSNTVEATGVQQLFQDSYLTQEWSRLASTLASDYNTWWNASNGPGFMVPVPAGHTSETFSGWKSLTAQDSHSVYAAPNTNPATACQATAATADYWFLVNSGSNTVRPGEKSAYILTVTPLDFTGTVSLKADASQIPDATTSWSTASISTSGSSTLTVTTSSSTPAGTYPLTMIANSGNITHTVTVSLVVQ